MSKIFKVGKKRTRGEILEMFEFYKNGETLAQVGKRYDLSAMNIFLHFRRERLDHNSYSKKRIRAKRGLKYKIDESLLRRLYLDELKTTKQISEIVSLTHEQVYRNLRYYGIPVRGKRITAQRETNGCREIHSEIHPGMLKRMVLEENLSIEEITVIFNCSRMSIYRWLNKFGIKTPLQNRLKYVK